jgi:signal transduction histidine kinase
VKPSRERLQILVPAGAVLVLVVLLTMLLVGSRSTESAVLDRLQESLQSYELHEAELTRDALLARSGLLRNYDPLAADRIAVNEAFTELQAVLAGAGSGTQRALQAPLDELGTAQQTKLLAVERFKSNNALLRNSLLYFAYVGPSMRLPLRQQALAAELGRLSYAVLSFLQSPSPATEQEILELLDHIERAAAGTSDLDSLVAHGRLLVRVLPQVDQQLKIIHETPIGMRVQALRAAAMARAESEERLAQGYRYVMYLASLSLLASLAWLLMRLRAAQDRLRQQRLALVESNKLANLGLHLEGVAHNLRSPLMAIENSARQVASFWPELQQVMDDLATRDPTLQLGGLPWQRQRGALESLPADLQTQSANLEDFAQYLLKMGQPQGGRTASSFDANEAIREALRLVRHAINRHTHRFEELLTPGLPPVRGDPFALGQVLVNLLNNALEALPDPHRAVRIRTQLAGVGKLAIIVEDEGTGIAPADLARLFEPFRTKKQTLRFDKQGHGGTGLGLSTSRAMLETMGASLRIDSVQGEGTRATIVMPLAGSAGGDLHDQA